MQTHEASVRNFGLRLKDLAYLVLKSGPKRLLWRIRWAWRTKQVHRSHRSTTVAQGFSLDDASIVYINLAKRSDRDRQIRAEFDRLGLTDVQRFEAIEHANGGLGCALSHKACLTRASENLGPVTIVCEDDVEFLASRETIEALIDEFRLDSRLDVLCLGNAPVEPLVKVSETLSIGNAIQTTSCYVLKATSVPVIANSASKSAARLRAGKSYERNALDQIWKKEQQGRLFFAVPNEQVARQRPSFSDIEKRNVTYKG